MYKVEYLITVDQKEQFCKSITAFNNLVQSIDGVSVSKSHLKVGELSLLYEVQTGETDGDKQRFFHIKLSVDDATKLPDFEDFLRNFRGVLHKASGKPAQTLWDGVSSNYALQMYPIVHEIENTMRKLITKFMLIKIGLVWTKVAIPKEVSDSIRLKKDAKPDHNYLNEVDFIQLSNFLFKEYSTANPSILIDAIRNAKDVSDLKISELKDALPRSNWDRFFSSIVQCQSEYLRGRWESLYEKRNLVAHNRPVSKADFDVVCKLSDEVLPKLKQAIEGIDQLAISDNDREFVSENAATTKTVEYSDFFAAWNEFHHQLYVLVTMLPRDDFEKIDLAQSRNNVRRLLKLITKKFTFTSWQKNEILELHKLRNYMVHRPDEIVPTASLIRAIDNIHLFTLLVKAVTEELIRADGIPLPSYSGSELDEIESEYEIVDAEDLDSDSSKGEGN